MSTRAEISQDIPSYSIHSDQNDQICSKISYATTIPTGNYILASNTWLFCLELKQLWNRKYYRNSRFFSVGNVGIFLWYQTENFIVFANYYI